MAPLRGEVWTARLDPIVGHEQAGTRPCLVVSTDRLNRGPAELVVVVPLTRSNRNVPLHVRVDPPDGGVKDRSFAMCESIRSISTSRLQHRWGIVPSAVLREVEDRLRILLDLP